MNIAVLPGDGVGREVVAEAVRVLEALEERFEFEFADVGGAAYEAHGHPLPDSTLKLAQSAQAVVDHLFDDVAANIGYRLTVDLPRQRVVEPDGTEHPFDVAPFRKHCLLNGFDDIELTLRHRDKIAAFEKKRLTEQPWLVKTS